MTIRDFLPDTNNLTMAIESQVNLAKVNPNPRISDHLITNINMAMRNSQTET